MRLIFKRSTSHKTKLRMKKKVRVRKRIFGSAERPRLSVFRSAKHIYAQIVDDVSGQTLVEASTLSIDVTGSTGSKTAAKAIGAEIAKRATGKKIKSVVFDRNGFRFHGRIQVLADAAREAGLDF